MSNDVKNETKYAYRYNTWTEQWQRKKTGKGHQWEDYKRELEEGVNYRDDLDFIQKWCLEVKKGGSCSDVARYYNETIRGVQSRRRSLNKKIAKQKNLTKWHEVLPELPGLTQTQRKHRDSHYVPKPKKLTLSELIDGLPEGIKDVLDLPEKKTAK